MFNFSEGWMPFEILFIFLGKFPDISSLSLTKIVFLTE